MAARNRRNMNNVIDDILDYEDRIDELLQDDPEMNQVATRKDLLEVCKGLDELADELETMAKFRNGGNASVKMVIKLAKKLAAETSDKVVTREAELKRELGLNGGQNDKNLQTLMWGIKAVRDLIDESSQVCEDWSAATRSDWIAKASKLVEARRKVEEIKKEYKDVFTTNPEGYMVVADVDRTIRQTLINTDFAMRMSKVTF